MVGGQPVFHFRIFLNCPLNPGYGTHLIDDVIHRRLLHRPLAGFPVILGQGEAVPIGIVQLGVIGPVVIARPPRFRPEHGVLRHTL